MPTSASAAALDSLSIPATRALSCKGCGLPCPNYMEIFPMAVEQQAILNALQTVLDPNTGKDFVTTKALKNLQVSVAALDSVSIPAVRRLS